MNRFGLLFLSVLTLLSASCGRPHELNVVDAVVKLSPVDTAPSALYFTVKGGERAVDLLRVSSPSVIRIEMHESVTDPKTGMLTMQPLERVTVPAKGKVAFKRGGKHVMLFGVNRVARNVEKLEMIFIFADGSQIEVTAPIEKMSAAGGSEHKGH